MDVIAKSLQSQNVVDECEIMVMELVVVEVVIVVLEWDDELLELEVQDEDEEEEDGLVLERSLLLSFDLFLKFLFLA